MNLQPPRSLNHIFYHAVENHDRHPLLSFDENGKTVHFSTPQFREAVQNLAYHLQYRCGLQTGDRVGILSENRPEWHVADFSILISRLISVPVYPTLSVSQLKHVLQQSECSAVVISTREQWEKIAVIRNDLPRLRHVISMDAWDGEPSGVVRLSQAMSDAQAERNDTWTAELQESALSVAPDTVATIVYTSGTTGRPKGVMLTHANIVFDLWQCLRALQFELVSPALSVLPLSHVFERLLCYGYFVMGIPIAYGDPYQLAQHYVRHRPAVMGCVPRMLEKIQETVMAQIQTTPAWRQRIAGGLLRVGHQHIGDGVHGHTPTFRARLLYPLADLLVYRKIRRRLGGRLIGMICGGGRLDPDVEKFFLAAGFRLVQGYGLTETSPVVALNPLGSVKPGTVGKPLDGVEISFSPEGEILTRGPHVMKGYFRDTQATAEAFQGNWFCTGDLGELDEHGYLRITGRKKEILVTSGGKNIMPACIEEMLCRSAVIEQAFVVGDGRKFVSALIVPNRAKIAALKNGKNGRSSAPASDETIALLWQEIEKHQRELSDYEKVKKFSLLDESVLQDLELFTPTQKLRRNVFEQKFRDRIDEMYRTAQ